MDQELMNTNAPTRPLARPIAWFKAFCKKPYAYLALCFIIPAAIMYLLYLVRGIHPFGNESVLVLDLNGQYVYFYEALRNAVYGKESLLYSFSRALGGEFLGIYAYYIASPLSYIVCLFPEGSILEALLFIFVLKTGLCGLTFGTYLHKTTRRPRPITVISFSAMYALCSYALVQQHNSMWIDALIWLPILTLSIEALIKEKKYKLFVLALTMTIMSNYYIGYMVCIYTALYFFYYYLAKGKNGENNPTGEKAHFPHSLARIALFSALALGIAAVMELGAYYSLTFGKNTFSNPDWSFELRYDVADLFVKLLPGMYDTVDRPGLPVIGCGALTLLLIPFYYLSKKISLREKIFTTALLCVFVASFIINPLDLIWHGFQNPNWLNYRYSFMFSFLLLIMAYRGMSEVFRRPSGAVFATGSILFLMVMILSKFEYENLTLGNDYGFTIGKIDPLRTVLFTFVIVVAYCAVLYLLRYARGKKKRQMSIVLTVVICVELFANGVIQMSSLDYDVVYSTYSSYNDYIPDAREAVDMVEAADNSFYRMEKTIHRKMNDPMALGIRGLSGSTSTLNKETIEFLEAMGYASYSHWSKYMGGNPVSDSILGIKYVLQEKEPLESRADYFEVGAYEDAMSLLWEVFGETDTYTIYQNPYALSIAYAVSDATKDFAFTKLDKDGDKVYLDQSPFERLNDLVTALTGADKTVRLFVPIEVNSTYTNGRKSNIAGHTMFTPYEDTSVPLYALFTTYMPKDALLYFYAPSEYPREATMEVNDKKWGEFMMDDSDRIKPLGFREEGEYVTAKLIFEQDKFYLKNEGYMFYYLDVDVFKSVMETLSANQFVIEDFSETYFKGTITTTAEAPMVMTTIPYDKGWQVSVDGKSVETFDAIEGVIAFEVEGAGTHTVEMRYMPKIISTGAIISLASLATFGAIVTTDTLIKRKREKAKDPE